MVRGHRRGIGRFLPVAILAVALVLGCAREESRGTGTVLGLAEELWTPTSEIYVDQSNPSCADDGPGTGSIPFCTIQAAVDAAQPGTGVAVKAGTYHEMVRVRTSGTSENPISIHAYQNDVVVIDSPDFAGFDFQGVSYVKVSGFEIKNAYPRAGSTVAHGGSVRAFPANGGRTPGLSHSIIAHNILRDSDSGVWLVRSEDNTIKDNVIYRVREAPIRLKRCEQSRVLNNLVIRNGQSLGSPGEHWGITFYCSPATKVIHNTIYEESGGGVTIYEGTSNLNGTGPDDYGYCVPSRGSVVRDNLVVVGGAGAPLVIGSSTTPTVTPDVGNVYTWNLFFHPSDPETIVSWGDLAEPHTFLSLAAFRAAWPGYGAHSLDEDPLFLDSENNDFRLSEASPARNAASDGTDLGVAFEPLLRR